MKNFSMVVILCLTLTLTACSNKENKTEHSSPQTNNQTISKEGTTKNSQTPVKTENKPNSSAQKVFSLDEFKKYTVENGTAAYVAIDGIVYDVTNNDKWQNGKHEGWNAGKDLSTDIKSSPHGKDVLKNLPIVGTLQK